MARNTAMNMFQLLGEFKVQEGAEGAIDPENKWIDIDCDNLQLSLFMTPEGAQKIRQCLYRAFAKYPSGLEEKTNEQTKKVHVLSEGS